MARQVEQQLFSIAECARILGYSTRTIRRKVADKVLTAVDINPEGYRPTWRITKESVERLMGKP